MYSAFSNVELIEQLPIKIESFQYHKEQIYIGSNTGILLHYKISVVKEEELEDFNPVYKDEMGLSYKIDLVKSYKHFCKKSIDAIEVIAELNWLLVLSDNQILAYQLNNLEFVSQLVPAFFLNQNKGFIKMNCFTGVEVIDEIPAMVTKLVILGKKSLILMRWCDSELDVDNTKEFSIPDKIKRLEFIDSNHLCLGTLNYEYYILSLISGEYKEVLLDNNSNNNNNNTNNKEKERVSSPTPSIKSNVTSMITDIAYTSTQYVSSYNPLNSILAGGDPVRNPMLRLNDGEMMLIIKSDLAIIINELGEIKDTPPIQLPNDTLFLLNSYPYLIIINNKKIEIRNLESQVSVQTIELTDMSSPLAVIKNKAPFIANSNKVIRLIPTHFANQINYLIEKKLYREAMILHEQNQNRLSEVKVISLKEIQRLDALDKFYYGRYQEAFDKFLKLDLNTQEILNLYPKRLNLLNKVEPLNSVQQKINVPFDYLEDAEAWPEHRFVEALDYLIQYLTQLRRVYLNEENLNNNELILIDTTLIKSYLMLKPKLVLPFLRVNNHVDITLVETWLIELNLNQALIELYYAKGLHRKALKLLVRLGEENIQEFTGSKPIRDYLMRLNPSQFDLVAEFGVIPLQKEPFETLDEMFINDEKEYLAEEVMALLERVNESLLVKYLDCLVVENTLKFHKVNDLVEVNNRWILLRVRILVRLFESEQLLELEKKLYQHNGDECDDSDSDSNIRAFKDHYDALIKFLTREDCLFRPEKILSRLPNNALLKPRAIILFQLKRYDQALNLLIEQLKDFEGAEKLSYNAQDPNIFLQLLKIYLPPLSDINGNENNNNNELFTPKLPYLPQAINLIKNYPTMLPPLGTLELLPSTLHLPPLSHYIETQLRKAKTDYHLTKIQTSLYKAHRQATNFWLSKQRQNFIKVEEDSLCIKCLKRLGRSAFGVKKDGLVHYSCLVE